MDEFCKVNLLLESFHFQLALRKPDNSSRLCLEAIKLLNQLSKHNDLKQHEKDIIKALSIYAINYYDSIKERHSSMSLDAIILWLNSKLHDQMFYPVIVYSSLLTSADAIFISNSHSAKNFDDSELQLPPNSLACFQPIEIRDWSTNQEDLINLHQDLLSNCSFVSSFLSLVHSGFVDKLVGLITPSGPAVNYNIVFNFNGCKRKVTIDNKLPIIGDNSKRYLTIRSNSNLQLYWPALIEKAYLKIMGKGYNIDGSNMAFDTYMLTGWIPDIFKIKDGRLPKSLKKVYNEHSKDNNITFGLGTGKISKALSEQVGLISHHDYVLLSMDEGQMSLKNPWLERNDKNRIVKVPMNELFQFRYAYVNWNADKLFKFKVASNFIYHNKGNNELFLEYKPQYGIHNNTCSSQEVWIFLERFLKQEESLVSIISIDIYKTSEGDKVLLAKEYKNLIKGEPTNARCCLTKFTMESNCYYTIVINSSINCSMSLSVLNNVSTDFKLIKSKTKYPNVLSVSDEWDFNNSGGNSSLSTYLKNPQFDLKVNQPTDLLIVLSAPQFITFQVFYWNLYDKNKGMRIFKRGDLLVDEPYSNGTQSYTFTSIEPGHYRIICSCNDAEIREKFTLKVYHRLPDPALVNLDKVTSSLGLFLNSTRFDWNGSNRCKVRIATKEFQNKFSFHIIYSSSNFMRPETKSNYRPAIRGSIFNEGTRRPIQINEEWDNNVYGIFIDCTIEEPGSYVLLVERFEPGYGSTEVEIGSNKHFNILE